MAGPSMAAEAAEQLSAAYPGTHEANVLAAALAPLQRVADVLLDDRGAYAGVFARDLAHLGALRWGAQWAGRDARGATEPQLRSVDWWRGRWRRGSVPALRAAIASVLTGNRDVRFYERSNPADFSADAPYDLTVVTTASETPGGAASIAEALRDVLPARLVVHIAVVDGYSWQDLLDSGRTWQQVLAGFTDWRRVYEGKPSP